MKSLNTHSLPSPPPALSVFNRKKPVFDYLPLRFIVVFCFLNRHLACHGAGMGAFPLNGSIWQLICKYSRIFNFPVFHAATLSLFSSSLSLSLPKLLPDSHSTWRSPYDPSPCACTHTHAHWNTTIHTHLSPHPPPNFPNSIPHASIKTQICYNSGSAAT